MPVCVRWFLSSLRWEWQLLELKSKWIVPLVVAMVILVGCSDGDSGRVTAGGPSDNPYVPAGGSEAAPNSTVGQLSPRSVGPTPPPVEMQPPLAQYHLIRSCGEVEAALEAPMFHLPSPPVAAGRPVCFLFPPDPARPADLPAEEAQGGIMYVPDSLSAEADSLETIVSNGGILIQARHVDSEPATVNEQREPEEPGGGHAPFEVRGAKGRVYRIFPGWANASWYPKEPDGQLIEVHLSGGYSPDEIVQFARSARTGKPA